MHSSQSVTFYILFSYLRSTGSTWFSFTNCLYDFNLALACRNSEMSKGKIRQIVLLKKTLLPVHYDNLYSTSMIKKMKLDLDPTLRNKFDYNCYVLADGPI